MPPGDYPKDMSGFNIATPYPELFDEIDFGKFALALGSDFYTYIDSATFLLASKYQKGYGSKLVMLLSSIESLSGDKYTPLEGVLRSSSFKKEMLKCTDSLKSWNTLQSKLSQHNSEHGSIRKIYLFYKNNLNFDQKTRIIRGMRRIRKYNKTKTKNGGFLFTPEHVPMENISAMSKDQIDVLLGSRVRHVIYDIRNRFVHQADYQPFPDKKHLTKRKVFIYARVRKGLPIDEWIITIPFENIYEITRLAFVAYWESVYYSKEQ